MQRVNEFSFYELAAKIHPLTLGVEVKLTDVWFDWWQARAELDGILKLGPFSVSVEAANKLYDAITAFVPEKWEDVVAVVRNIKAETEVPLPTWRIYKLTTAAKEFETILGAECQVLDTYFISKKGVYSTADLVDHAHYHVPEETRSKVPDQTKGDFDQAGK
jgi:hypothetical protein